MEEKYLLDHLWKVNSNDSKTAMNEDDKSQF